MFQLFQPRTRFIKGIVRPSQSDYIKQTYLYRLSKLRHYYQERTFYLKNDHILVRLLNIGLGSLRTSYETFVWTSMDRTDALIRHFQFTGSASYGKIWYGTFYGEGSYEIIIGDDAEFDIRDIIQNWKTATPVKVLTHPISDFGLTIPNGKTNHYIDGLSVIYINIPMLMLQYRMFIEEQLKKQKDGEGDGIISPKLFLYRYVLPGMMVSHLDHVFVNRIINLEEGVPMSESLTRSPFFQAEAGNEEGSGIINSVNRAQEAVLVKLTQSQVNYDQMLANIFVVTEEDALNLLSMPAIAPTRQVWWAFLMARLKHMKFLLKIGSGNIAGQNRLYQNRIIIDLSRLLDSHVLERMLTAELLEIAIEDINETLALARS